MIKFRSVEWASETPGNLIPGHVRILDQTKLPEQIIHIDTADIKIIFNAIKTLQVRGAPAIGITAAMGIAAAIQKTKYKSSRYMISDIKRMSKYLSSARPTAINLFWALNRMEQFARMNSSLAPDELKKLIAREANIIRDEDAAMCRAIGKHGVTLLKNGDTVLTHCNAGALATSEFGTALAPIYTAAEQGMKIKVFADETRPLLQGSRLTVWELMQAGINTTLICDNMAASLMRAGKITGVVVGADRIAMNGDTANKIGTYGVAVLAQHHKIPFYIAAPSTTFDLKAKTGKDIPIEEREGSEVSHLQGRQLAPKGMKIFNPAFDVTPAKYISGIITEAGVLKAPYHISIKKIRALLKK